MPSAACTARSASPFASLSYLGDAQSLTRFLSEPRCFAELGRMAETLRKMYSYDEDVAAG